MAHRLGFLGWFIVLLVGSGSAAAQTPAGCAFDTAARVHITQVTLGLAPGWIPNPDKPIPPDYLTAAQAIHMHYQPPAQVGLPFWARTVPGILLPSVADTLEAVGFGLNGYVRFRLTDQGRLADDQIEVANGSWNIIASVVEAVKRADSAGAFAPPTRGVRADQGTIILRFVQSPNTQGPSVALLRVTVPAVVADSAPELVSMPRIRYPRNAARARAMGRVVLQLVVKADGRPDTNTVQLIQAEYREFALVTLRGIKDARFKPASIAGCPVPTIVRLPFDFRVRH